MDRVEGWFRGLTFATATALGVTVLGCASPGPPRPPSLHLPEPVAKLEARRVGDQVVLTWVTSANTTDGDRIRGGLAASVCRSVVVLGGAAEACDAVRRVAVTAGATEFVDALPPGLSLGTPKLIAYRVELLNDRGRSAGRSEAVYAAAGQAPLAAGTLTVSPRREAALIQWGKEAAGAGDRMEVRRTLTATAAGPVGPEGKRKAGRGQVRGAGTGSGRDKATPLNAKARPAGEVTLTSPALGGGDAGAGDPGGMLDRTVRDGESYVYVGQRVRQVSVGGHELELRGAASPSVAWSYRDTFAPIAPAGLVSVPAGGLGAARSIDLSWEPNAEGDLLGYNVYRREGTGAWTKVTAEPVSSAGFRDLAVVAGHEYRYRVTAVDRRRNESAASVEVRESLRE